MLKRKIEQKLIDWQKHRKSQAIDYQGLPTVRQDIFCP